MSCKKIPAIIELDSYNGNYAEYEDAVYELYKNTFECDTFYWDGKIVAHKKYPVYKDKPGTFWHIVSSGEDEQSRIPDLRRYERIAWPAYILRYCKENCKELLIWKNLRKGKTRVVIWCKDIDYVVVLDERKEFYIFWTAYPITYQHTKKKLMKEYEEYKKNQ